MERERGPWSWDIKRERAAQEKEEKEEKVEILSLREFQERFRDDKASLAMHKHKAVRANYTIEQDPILDPLYRVQPSSTEDVLAHSTHALSFHLLKLEPCDILEGCRIQVPCN